MKKLMKELLAFAAAVCLIFTLCACSSGGDSSDAAEAEEHVSTVDMYEKDGERYVVDCLGREVLLPKEINKIASMHLYGVKMIYAMQLQDYAAFKLGIGDDFLNMPALDPDYAALPDSPAQSNGSTITEALLALGVNLVFTNANNGPEEADTYANAGMAAIAVRGETFDEVYDTARMMGFIFDKPERAEEVISFISGKLETISDRVSSLKEKDIPSVMLCGSSGIYSVATRDMFQSEMIEYAGGTNVGAEYTGSKWAKIGAEDVINWDPEYIILSSSCTDEELQEVLNDPALAPVSAIQNGNVYVFPSTLGWWDFPLPQAMLGIAWLATVLHPDLFEDIDMLSLANETYELMYGYSYTELGGELD